MVKRLLFVLLLAVTPGVGRADPLSLLIRGHQVSQPVFSLFAAPGEEIRVGVPGLDARSVDLQSVEGVSVLTRRSKPPSICSSAIPRAMRMTAY
jgi:hypothetical protein